MSLKLTIGIFVLCWALGWLDMAIANLPGRIEIMGDGVRTIGLLPDRPLRASGGAGNGQVGTGGAGGVALGTPSSGISSGCCPSVTFATTTAGGGTWVSRDGCQTFRIEAR